MPYHSSRKGRMERKIKTSLYLLLLALAQHCTSIYTRSLGQRLSFISGLCHVLHTGNSTYCNSCSQTKGFFPYSSLEFSLDLNALLDQGLTRRKSKYNSSFYIIVLNITRHNCTSYQIEGGHVSGVFQPLGNPGGPCTCWLKLNSFQQVDYVWLKL